MFDLVLKTAAPLGRFPSHTRTRSCARALALPRRLSLAGVGLFRLGCTALCTIPHFVLPSLTFLIPLPLFYIHTFLSACTFAGTVIVLQAIRKALLARAKPMGLIVADLLADVSFFIGFIVYPGASTTIFMFFMGETFGGPGEDGITVMRFDRSIETGSELYKAFIPYALVMMLLYPIGAICEIEPETARFLCALRSAC